jgi:DNA-binding transcriptional LysR family regulator
MSQPPLTVAIRKLEAELGATLFDRGPRGVMLTAAGAAALDTARAALAQAERFHRTAREGGTGERGRLRVGFVGSAVFELLPRIIPEFRRRYPLVELVLEEATSVGIARNLQAGVMDVGLVRLPLLEIAAIDARVIDHDELHVAIPAANRLARGERIALEMLENEPFILQARVSVLHAITLMACHDAGFVPRVAQEAAQFSAILSLVRSGLGVALVPARAANSVPQGVRLLRLARRVPIETGVALPPHGASLPARNFAATIDSEIVSIS